MRDQIRVLMLLPNLRVSNGVTSYAMNYFNRINHNSVHMDFAIYKKKESPYEDEILSSGSKIFLLPPVKNLPAHVKACIDILKNEHYDIIHDNSMLVTYPIMRIAKKYVPVRILHSHNSKLGETAMQKKRSEMPVFSRSYLDKQMLMRRVRILQLKPCLVMQVMNLFQISLTQGIIILTNLCANA